MRPLGKLLSLVKGYVRLPGLNLRAWHTTEVYERGVVVKPDKLAGEHRQGGRIKVPQRPMKARP